MFINLPKTVLKNYNLTPAEIDERIDPLFCWYGAKIKVDDDLELLAFINQLTRFLVVTPFEPEADLAKQFLESLQKTLEALKLPQEAIKAYIDENKNITFFASSNRRLYNFARNQGLKVADSLKEGIEKEGQKFLDTFNIYRAAAMFSYLPEHRSFYTNEAFIPAQQFIDILLTKYYDKNYNFSSLEDSGVLLEISIQGSPYPYKRTILVPANISFTLLASIIQDAIGWEGYHLDRFDIRLEGFSGPILQLERMPLDFFDPSGDKLLNLFVGKHVNKKMMDDYLISDFLGPGFSYEYIYDFGDNWKHIIKLKDVLAHMGNEAVLIDSVGASPPEDIGGAQGWRYALSVLEDRDAGMEIEDREFLELLGDWSPEAREHPVPRYLLELE